MKLNKAVCRRCIESGLGRTSRSRVNGPGWSEERERDWETGGIVRCGSSHLNGYGNPVYVTYTRKVDDAGQLERCHFATEHLVSQ